MDIFRLHDSADMAAVAQLLPRRNDTGAKWDFGRLLAVCGSRDMPGAAVLSCGSALRSGVGLVEIASVPEVTAAVSGAHPECILRPLTGEGGALHCDDLPALLSPARRATALLCGCGLGRDRPQGHLVWELIPRLTVPAVLDADALSLLAEQPALLRRARVPIVLTPHVVEMHRLTGLPADAIAADPAAAAASFAAKYGVTLVLKGCCTAVAAPGGKLWQLDAPNSGMAKGGSGDVLAGLIAGLLAQGCPPFDSACLGVYLHALAGDLACRALSARAMLPRDVIDRLGPALLLLEEACR